jgi:Rieske Fe-S protein
MAQEAIDRRALLAGVCGVIAATIAPLPASAANSVKKLPGGRLSVQLNKIPELRIEGGSVRVGVVKGKQVAITRTGTKSYKAISLSCPHQGVTVARTDTGWRCDAHGSEFEANGSLVLGPATTDLAAIPMKISRGVATLG